MQQYDVHVYSNRLVYIIVPHHGGNVGNSSIICSNLKTAIISSGPNNYGYPKSNVINRYMDARFVVRRTDEEGGDVDIIIL